MVNGNDANKEFVVLNDRAAKLATRTSSTSTAMSVASSATVTSPQKSFDEMSRLRKLVSLSYYSCKLKGWFHREDRDTIVCEEDEEAFRRDNFHEIIGCDEFASPAATFFNNHDHNKSNTTTKAESVSSYTSWVDSGSSTVASSALRTQPMTPSNQDEVSSEYEPSKEQRWCTNCAKCFQRKLSHYDQFCGLDCKTAHRFRLVA
ncbi:hypothetical protein Gpo141_00010996 [Globisporangium polare]